jgi:hypothetical protein
MSEYPPLEAGSRPISYPDLFAKACLDFRVAYVPLIGLPPSLSPSLLLLSFSGTYAYSSCGTLNRSVKTGTRRIFLVTDDDDPAKDLDTKAAFMGKKAMRTKLKV